MKRILVVDDDPSFNAMLTAFLQRSHYEVRAAHASSSALAELRSKPFDLVLTDFQLPDMDGLELIRNIKKLNPRLPVILITKYSDIRTAVTSIKLGAYEFVNKPVNPDELLITVEKALNTTTKDNVADDAAGTAVSDYIVGKNKASIQLWEHVEMVAPTKMSVLIYGESGTGKEHVARMLWQKSKRAHEKFIALDCGVLSAELAASELFGHVKGAFTGALHDKKGQLELAHKGTIFLDEIGNLPYDVQVKLLRAVQERTIRRVGSDREISVDVRILAATNDSLQNAIARDSFRNDLYHRLNEFELRIPPLRERMDDLEEYIAFFLREACEELDKKVLGITPDTLAILKHYPWPGNLRELKNIIKRATLLCPGEYISPAQLPGELTDPAPLQDAPEESEATTNLKALQEEQEKKTILRVLKETRYNKTKTAKLLNIDRTTLYAKIKQYGIDA